MPFWATFIANKQHSCYPQYIIFFQIFYWKTSAKGLGPIFSSNIGSCGTLITVYSGIRP